MTKILFITSQPGPTLTGADRMLSQLADRAEDQGWTVFIAAPKSSMLHSKYSGTHISLINIDLTPTPGGVGSTRRAIHDIDPDVVHANSIYPLAFLRALGCLKRNPATAASVLVDPSSSHPLAVKRFKGLVNFARNLIARIESKNIDRIFTLSPILEKRLHALGVRGHIVVSSSGVDISGLESNSSEGIQVPEGYPIISTAVGQLERLKGVEYLIGAFAKVQADYPNAQLLIAGSGSLKESLRGQAEQLGVGNNIHFLGYLGNVAPLLANSDIYALPSLSEGINTSVLEAMALGRPVVATDAGGTRDIIEDGVTGILVPPASVNPLAEAMLRLTNDKEAAKVMGQKGKQKVSDDFPKDGYSDVVFSEYSEMGLVLDSATKPTP